MELTAKNFVSRICPIELHAQTDKNHNHISQQYLKQLDVPIRLLIQIVISSGMSCPLQSGQDRPHPIPESVFVTSAPPNRINSIPMVVNIENHLRERCKTIHLLKFSLSLLS